MNALNNNPILSVKDLSISFTSNAKLKKHCTKAVDGISFDVFKGETFGLVGESGCGKTTTGRCIIRLYTPTSGSITLNGQEITGPMTKRLRKYIAGNISMIFQDSMESLNPRMTIAEIIGEGLQVKGLKDKNEILKKVYEILEKVGLTKEQAGRYPHEFSGGQRQRIGIARAIVVAPSLIIADEPVSALDVSIQAQVINLLNDLKNELDLTILFIAHNLSVVKYFSDRIGVMYCGKLLEVASTQEIYEHPYHPYTKALLSASPNPNPLSEKRRERLVYEPEKEHDYTVEKPEMIEISENHWIFASNSEVERYRTLDI
jgi:ABC-type oligopeptide transport system ATPase subunit